MSRALAARIERLERRKANQAPSRQFGVFGGEALWRNEERGGVVCCLPRFEPGMFGERCSRQQSRLFENLAEHAKELESEDSRHGDRTGPLSVGFNDQLAPGAKPLKFRYYTDASGQEWQVSLESGQKWKV